MNQKNKNIISAFNHVIEITYQDPTLSKPISNKLEMQCDDEQFILSIPEIARFSAYAHKNAVFIEKAHEQIQNHTLDVWLYGTIFAYFLQHQGYTVLHGSAMLMNNKAVIFSGPSGAGKSTLAGALYQKGYPFLTDDLVVLQRTTQGQYAIIPGPSQIKLWKDSMQYLNNLPQTTVPIANKINKFAIPIDNKTGQTNPINTNQPHFPICAFFELHNHDSLSTINFSPNAMPITGVNGLRIIMNNAYRYFMLEPLKQLQNFFLNCSAITQQISIYQLTRNRNFENMDSLISQIEHSLAHSASVQNHQFQYEVISS